jgi:hypothetical protein
MQYLPFARRLLPVLLLSAVSLLPCAVAMPQAGKDAPAATQTPAADNPPAKKKRFTLNVNGIQVGIGSKTEKPPAPATATPPKAAPTTPDPAQQTTVAPPPQGSQGSGTGKVTVNSIATAGAQKNGSGPQAYQPPEPIMPAGGEIAWDGDMKKPIAFRWTPVVPKPKDLVKYRISVWQLMQGQTGRQAIKANTPIITKDVDNFSTTQAIDPNFITGTCKPPSLCTYVWSVQALDKKRRPVGVNDGIVSMTAFHYEPKGGTSGTFLVVDVPSSARPVINDSPTIGSLAGTGTVTNNGAGRSLAGQQPGNGEKSDYRTVTTDKLQGPAGAESWILSWTTNAVTTSKKESPQGPVTYRVQVWQILPGQDSAQAIKANQPILMKLTEEQQLGVTANAVSGSCKPPYLCDFVWNVQALDSKGKPIGGNRSYIQNGSFSYDSRRGSIVPQQPGQDRGVINKGLPITNPNFERTVPNVGGNTPNGSTGETNAAAFKISENQSPLPSTRGSISQTNPGGPSSGTQVWEVVNANPAGIGQRPGPGTDQMPNPNGKAVPHETVGVPIQGTEVGLEHDPHGMVARGETNAGGNVTFSNLKVGNYTFLLADTGALKAPAVIRITNIRANASGLASAPIQPGKRGASANVLDTSGRKLTVPIDKDGGSITLNVSSSQGVPER